ncbi:MAG: FeoB-associated Cys-rich membrane protein [Desulfosalsimonas sp.]
MIQEIIVFAIIGLALGFAARNTYRKLAAKQPSCGCGCTDCGNKNKCDQDI